MHVACNSVPLESAGILDGVIKIVNLLIPIGISSERVIKGYNRIKK